jgi:cysteine desulfurase/selenocysteine lyase
MTPRVAQRFDATQARRDFPVLAQRVHARPLTYLDSAATSLPPWPVIEAVRRFDAEERSNIHRGLHQLSERATAAYEEAREKVQRFLGAGDAREIVFVRGTTEAINLVAHIFGNVRVRAGDEIVVSELEHHSNIVPWQLVCERLGARLRVAPIDDASDLRWEELERLIGPRTRLVAVAHVSNALGTVNPVARIVALAHSRGVPVLVDGAQAAPHLPVDVRALDCDFYAVSGHKMYGPTGIGALYGKAEWLEALPPFQGGGDMILSVSFEKTIYNRIPFKFEAGTPNIAGAIGLGAAVDYLERAGRAEVAVHESALLERAARALACVPGVRLVGAPRQRACVISFIVDGVHPHDVGTVLDQEGVALRTGHHCAQPLLARLGLEATARASFGLYNTDDDIERLIRGLERVKEIFHV